MNSPLLGKGFKYLGITLLLFIVAPILLTMAYKAIQVYPSGFKYILALVFLVFCIGLLLYAVYFGFKTFKILLDAIFDKK